MSGWAAKQAKKAEWAEARKLDGLDNKETTVNDTRDAAMGKGEDQLFEKKLSKEEQKAEKERKKAEARAKRDAKKAAKGKPLSKKKSRENLEEAAAAARVDESEADRLAREEHIIATYASQKEQHAHAKDISVRDVTISFHGATLIENTDFALNYGNRYGFIGPNGADSEQNELELDVVAAMASRVASTP
jgi:ATP-binding cassette subfamily F protein 2